uniref:Claudin n=1 Tax=Catagonus wagneri TaxID=51154 RepID=A0A8C3WPM0_9CETA
MNTGSKASTASEIIAFTVSISGWVLASSTLPADYRKASTTTTTYWAKQWKMCVTNSMGISNCRDFPSVLALDSYSQVCRGLMIVTASPGFSGSMFALFGMKGTKVGGSDKATAKIACLAGIVLTLSGLCPMTGCSLYANSVTVEFSGPLYVDQKYQLGAALFIGQAAASLCIIGAVIFCFSISDNNKKTTTTGPCLSCLLGQSITEEKEILKPQTIQISEIKCLHLKGALPQAAS